MRLKVASAVIGGAGAIAAAVSIMTSGPSGVVGTPPPWSARLDVSLCQLSPPPNELVVNAAQITYVERVGNQALVHFVGPDSLLLTTAQSLALKNLFLAGMQGYNEGGQ